MELYTDQSTFVIKVIMIAVNISSSEESSGRDSWMNVSLTKFSTFGRGSLLNMPLTKIYPFVRSSQVNTPLTEFYVFSKGS